MPGKLPELPGLSLAREGDMRLLTESQGWTNVTLGLFTGSSKSVLLVWKSAREAFQLLAPFRVAQPACGLDPTTASKQFRVFREGVPDARPSLCLVLSSEDPVVVSSWVAALRAVPAAGAASSVVLPPGHINLHHGVTGHKLLTFDLGRCPTVSTLMDLAVNRVMREVPTAYTLCYTQPVANTIITARWAVSDSGPASLASFAGEAVYLVPRQDLQQGTDVFALWLESLSSPSAVIALRGWQQSTAEIKSGTLLPSIERTVLCLREDSCKKLYSFCNPKHPVMVLGRLRLHELGESISLVSSAGSVRSETLNVLNYFDRPVVLCASSSFCGGVEASAFPEVLCLAPKEKKQVRFDFFSRDKHTTPRSIADGYLRFFSSAGAGEEGYPVVLPVTVSTEVVPQPLKTVKQLGTTDLKDAEHVDQTNFAGLGSFTRLKISGVLMAAGTVPLPSGFSAELAVVQGMQHQTLLLPFAWATSEETSEKQSKVSVFYRWASLSDFSTVVLHSQARPAPLALRLKVALDVASALQHIHSFSVAHGRLCPELVQFASTDFNLESFDCSSPPNGLLVGPWLGVVDPDSFPASPYFSPSPSEPQSREADVYGFAMLLYSLLFQRLPFSDLPKATYDNRSLVEGSIAGGSRPTLYGVIPKELTTLLRECWAQNPSHRPGMVEVVTRTSLALASLAAETKTGVRLPELPMLFLEKLQSYTRNRPPPLAAPDIPPPDELPPSQFSTSQNSASVASVTSVTALPPPPPPPKTEPPPPPPLLSPSGLEPPGQAVQSAAQTAVVTVGHSDGRTLKLRVSKKADTTSRVLDCVCRLLRLSASQYCLLDQVTHVALTDAGLILGLNSGEVIQTDLAERASLVAVTLLTRTPDSSEVVELGLASRAATARALALCACSVWPIAPVALTTEDGVRIDYGEQPLDALAQPSGDVVLHAVQRSLLQAVKVVCCGDSAKTLSPTSPFLMEIDSSALMQVVLRMAATKFGFQPSHCHLCAAKERQRRLAVNLLRVSEYAASEGISATDSVVEVFLQHCEARKVKVLSSDAAGQEQEPFEQVVDPDAKVLDVLKSATQSLGLDVDSHALVIEKSGRALASEELLGQLSCEDIVLRIVPKEKLLCYEIATEEKPSAPAFRILFVPAAEPLCAELVSLLSTELHSRRLIDAVSGIEILPVEKVREPSKRLLAFNAESDALRLVAVTSGQRQWSVRATSQAKVGAIRQKCCAAFGAPEASLLQDKDGCVLDDECMLDELEDATMVLDTSSN